ncbi:MAG: ribonuclease HII [Patescibacteria group bacterium]
MIMKVDEFHYYKILIRKRKKANFGWGQETRLLSKHKNILSIDEAGRGSLAGPLSVGGLFLDKNVLKILKNEKIEFYDSKKFKEDERDFIYKIIKKLGLPHKVFLISHKTIEKYGINGAFLIGIKKLIEYFEPRCVAIDGRPLSSIRLWRIISARELVGGGFGLVPKYSVFREKPPRREAARAAGASDSWFSNRDYSPMTKINFLISRSLYTNKSARLKQFFNKIPIHSFIKGDEKLNSIGAASICAKVRRDNYVINLSKKYPKYKLEKHKGYGTELHRNLIKKHGISAIHRKSFCRNILATLKYP